MSFHIGLIRRRYNPYGGAERFIENLGVRLLDSGIQLTIISENWQSNADHKLPVIQVNVQGVSRFGRLKSFEYGVQQVLAGSRFDLVQSHERLTGVDLYRLGDGVHRAWLDRLEAERGYLGKLALSFDFYHRAILARERAMARDTRLTYIANSEMVGAELQRIYGVHTSRIRRIENGVDTVFFHPPSDQERLAARDRFGITDGRSVIAYVGSGFERKGAFLLVQALRFVPHAHLLICGHDKSSDRLARLVADLGLTDRVSLCGPLADVRPVLWAADIFALPSLYDPSPNAVLEAMACGLPVVCSASIGTAEEIVRAGAGLTSDRSVSGLARVLDQACDAGWQKDAHFAARAVALDHDQMCIRDQWVRFYLDRGHVL